MRSRHPGIGRWLATTLGLVFFVAHPAATLAQDEPVQLERRVKAAFLYKFAAYVEWPPSSFPRYDTPVKIGVLGDDPLAAELSRMVANRTIERRVVTVQRLKADEPLDQVHILFVGDNEIDRLGGIARRIQSRPVLVVSNSPGALTRGSMINFILSEGRVRFEISLPAAEEKGLSFRSGLLAVAHSVVPRTP